MYGENGQRFSFANSIRLHGQSEHRRALQIPSPFTCFVSHGFSRACVRNVCFCLEQLSISMSACPSSCLLRRLGRRQSGMAALRLRFNGHILQSVAFSRKSARQLGTKDAFLNAREAGDAGSRGYRSGLERDSDGIRQQTGADERGRPWFFDIPELPGCVEPLGVIECAGLLKLPGRA